AADGSQISWTTANDVITAVGSNNQRVEISQVATNPPSSVTQYEFFEGGGNWYYVLTHQIIPSTNTATVQAAADVNNQVVMVMSNATATTASAHIYGSVSGKGFDWTGTLPLGDTPTRLLDKIGIDQALAPQVAKADYFTPALKAIADQTAQHPDTKKRQ